METGICTIFLVMYKEEYFQQVTSNTNVSDYKIL